MKLRTIHVSLFNFSAWVSTSGLKPFQDLDRVIKVFRAILHMQLTVSVEKNLSGVQNRAKFPIDSSRLVIEHGDTNKDYSRALP